MHPGSSLLSPVFVMGLLTSDPTLQLTEPIILRAKHRPACACHSICMQADPTIKMHQQLQQ